MSTTSARAPRFLERDVLRYIRAHELLRPGETVVVGVSGGADSTALLLLLVALAPKLSIDVRAAHFDHTLRGKKASQRERRAVTVLAEGLGLPLSTGAGDVRVYARERRLGIEEAARGLRYAFLAQAAHKCGARTVAVGHTADDQVETVLMHILRGSGLNGLAGMLPRSSWPTSVEGSDLSLVRPLLAVNRRETEAYCRDMGRQPIEDTTNRSRRFRRNVVRYELLPLLREHARGVDAALLRLARAAAMEREALDRAATELLDDAGSMENGRVRLSLAKLRRAPEGLLPQIMRAAAALLLGDAQDLGERHLVAMAEATRRTVGTELDLPRGLRLRVEYDEIVLAMGDAEPEMEALPVEGVALVVPGMTEVAGWRLEATTEDGAGQAKRSDWKMCADADSVVGGLRVRRRRPGDRYRPLGQAGEKKLQDVFVDAKVPRRERDGIPVVCDEAGIVWVAGYRVAERAKVTASTRRTMRLEAQRNDRWSRVALRGRRGMPVKRGSKLLTGAGRRDIFSSAVEDTDN